MRSQRKLFHEIVLLLGSLLHFYVLVLCKGLVIFIYQEMSVPLHNILLLEYISMT